MEWCEERGLCLSNVAFQRHMELLGKIKSLREAGNIWFNCSYELAVGETRYEVTCRKCPNGVDITVSPEGSQSSLIN